MNSNVIKNKYFDDKARFFKLLGSPVKLRLLQYISFAPRTVEECAEKFSQSIQNISLHLLALKKANVLNVQQVKNYRYYYLADSEAGELVHAALDFNPQTILPENLVIHSSLKELVAKSKKNEIVLIDLRSTEESSYLPVIHSHHFSSNLSHLPEFLKTFPKKSLFVFFCKGRMCERLSEAVFLCAEKDLSVKGAILSAKELKR